MDSLIRQDALTTRLLSFLADYSDHWFTVEELANEERISGSEDAIRQRIEAMLKEKLVGVRERDGKRSFQAILSGK